MFRGITLITGRVFRRLYSSFLAGAKLQQDLDDSAAKQHAEMSKLHDDKERISKERDKLSSKLKELSQGIAENIKFQIL